MSPVKQYDPREDPVLKDFIGRLKQELGERLKGAILFGSRTRGDADGHDQADPHDGFPAGMGIQPPGVFRAVEVVPLGEIVA